MNIFELNFVLLFINYIIISFLSHFTINLKGSIDRDQLFYTIFTALILTLINVLIIRYKGLKENKSEKEIREAFVNPVYLFFLSFAFFNIIITFLCRWLFVDCRYNSEKCVEFSMGSSAFISIFLVSFFYTRGNDSGNKIEKEQLNTEKDKQDRLEEQGNVESEDYDNNEFDEGGNTEGDYERNSFSENSQCKEIIHNNQSELDEKSKEKDIRQIEYNKENTIKTEVNKTIKVK